MVTREFAIRSINLTGGEALTLEKAEDRVEFEALMTPGLQGDGFMAAGACDDKCYVVCGGFNDSPPCNPMTPGPVPPVPPPTPVPCPELK